MRALGRYLRDKLFPFVSISAFMGLGIWAEAPDWSITFVGIFWCLAAINLYPDRWINWILGEDR